MKASAPGKVVLSGAYSVLEGAPAIVSAVNRYVHADATREASIVTAEVRAALPAGPVPFFDASELRAGDRKLGLGSSAAILVASLAAARGALFSDEDSLHQAIYATALRAHREAQGGGSGIDVAASIWGGTLIARRIAPEQLQADRVALPSKLVVQAWASSVSASTPELLASVAAFREQHPSAYDVLMQELLRAASEAAEALQAADVEALIGALDAQRRGLARLGDSAGVPIVTRQVGELAEHAASHAAAVLPSGAGGGDIVLWAADRPAPAEFHAHAAQLGHSHVALTLDARGVFCTPGESNLS